VLAYQVNGHIYSARVRVPSYSAEFGVTATESHARDERAFYPHRRIHGNFTVTIECVHYREFQQLMRWLNHYAAHLLDSTEGKIAMPMHFAMASRNVNRLGILISGISDHDNVGSMVFSVPLTFITLSVPNDPAIPMLYPQNTSEFQSPRVDPNISQSFYPVTGNSIVDSNIYDNLNKIDPSAITLPDPGTSTNQDPNPTGTNPVPPSNSRVFTQ
jgi:hypothetical protein